MQYVDVPSLNLKGAVLVFTVAETHQFVSAAFQYHLALFYNILLQGSTSKIVFLSLYSLFRKALHPKGPVIRQLLLH
jgi:hypothetical protein